MKKLRSILAINFAIVLVGCASKTAHFNANNISNLPPSYEENQLVNLICHQDKTCINQIFADNWLAKQQRQLLNQAFHQPANPKKLPTNISLENWQYHNWQVVDVRLFWMKYFSPPTWYNDQRIFDLTTHQSITVYATLSPAVQKKLTQDLENSLRQEMQNVIDNKGFNSSVIKSLNITVNVPRTPATQRQWLDEHLPTMLNHVTLLKRNEGTWLKFCSSQYGITNLTQFEPCVTLPAKDYLEN